MGSSSLQISALLLALAGLIILLVTTVSNKWKISSTATAVITANWIYEGLWMNCAATALGSVQCKKFFSLLSLDTYIQACRALMIISIVLGLLATVLSLFGLKCTQVGMSNENTKVKISVTGGAIFILAGLSSMVAVSWYAARITAQFFDPLYGGTKWRPTPHSLQQSPAPRWSLGVTWASHMSMHDSQFLQVASIVYIGVGNLSEVVCRVFIYSL
ncbi:claudin-19-like isoform X3 [Chrysemys picta bellii]|uniref:claudin-19-like isoform X3 n=1 Tax=Chrysemys picta bellii TaxID=8478 RepID=UPI0032B2145C